MKERKLVLRLCVLFTVVCMLSLFTTFGNVIFNISEINKKVQEIEPLKRLFENSQNTVLNRTGFITSNESRLPTILHMKPCNKIAFLKTHKTGSSTAQNIFLRYGQSRELTFLISKQRTDEYDNVISVTQTLNEHNTLPPPPNKTYDILCCHVLYNRKAFQKYMPFNAAYIAIIREPFKQFLSTLNYFHPRYIFKGTTPTKTKVLEYLQDPWSYEKGVEPRYSFTNNRMAVEFDFPLHLFYNYSTEQSMAYIKKLDKEFHLVIILEHFIESIVLMRRMLGWTTKDILYIQKNSADEYSFDVDSKHRHLYERFARLDYDLYNFFYYRFLKQIRNEGIDFYLELLQFRYIRENVENFCRFVGDWSDSYFVPGTKWNEAFTVSTMDCDYLQLDEAEFIYGIRQRQYA